jgi:hypothetical protein
MVRHAGRVVTAMTEVEAGVQPDSVGDDCRWESVAFVGIHGAILAVVATLPGNAVARATGEQLCTFRHVTVLTLYLVC